MTITFTGTDGVKTYKATVLKAGLTLYAKHQIQANRFWTPKAMLRAAGHITGKTYQRREYDRAISDLGAWLANFGTTGGKDESTT